MPTHLSLFSGIGGLDLAAEWAGFETVGQCEWADYPTKVLEKHWPNVPRWRDIKTLTGDDFYQKTGLRTVDVISGGFPCQPFSSAGQQKGEADDRFLWPEMLRVIEEINPAWVLGENVDGLLSAKFDETLKNIIGGLEAAGYYVRVFSFEAAQVGALHRRRRTFIVANRNGRSGDAWRPKPERQRWAARFTNGGHDVADTLHDGSAAGLTNSPRWQERQAAEPNNCGEVVANSDNGQCDATHQKIQTGWNTACNGSLTVPNAESPERERRRRETRERRAIVGCGGRWTAQPGLGGGFNGISNILDEIGGLNSGAKNRANEILCNLRESFNAEKIQREAGRFRGVSEKEILLAFLCEYEEICFRSGTPETRGTVSEEFLRSLWRTIEAARASHRREYKSQFAGEYSNALFRLSHGAPSIVPQTWKDNTWEDGIPRVAKGVKDRVSRIKGLGNAVVPQQAYPIFATIYDLLED